MTVRAAPPPPSKNTSAVPVPELNVAVDTPAPFKTREEAFPKKLPAVDNPIVLDPAAP